MNVVTRFPPSPTGFLHVGSLRTALYNYLFARKHEGKFILRVEDTDRARLVDGAVESLIRTLNTVNLEYDEGPFLSGDKIEERGEAGPYVQSERLEIYKEHLQILLDNDSAYYCFCTKERLTELRETQKIAKLPTKYDRTCCGLGDEEIKAKLDSNESHVVRLRIPEGETTFEDEIRGNITIKNSEIDDQVLMKADGFPTYHLAVVVDDNLMGVTHVIRGEEWISSVPKHVVLYDKFGFDLPKFAHLPLILNPDKSKLSKRQGDVAVEDFLEKGYLPEALVNFVSLLGFNPTADREIYDLSELISTFELSSINKGGAVFDIEKLKWMNSEYIKKMDTDKLIETLKPLVKQDVSSDKFKKIVEVEKSRLVLLNDISERVGDYVDALDYDEALIKWKKSDLEDATTQLKNVSALLSEIDSEKFGTMESIEREVKEYISNNELSNGNVLWPLRVSLSGKEKSPSPFELLWVLGKEESLKRIDHAIQKNS
jgi:nondiscriminating glutamyl-tRNA synthetase